MPISVKRGIYREKFAFVRQNLELTFVSGTHGIHVNFLMSLAVREYSLIDMAPTCRCLRKSVQLIYGYIDTNVKFKIIKQLCEQMEIKSIFVLYFLSLFELTVYFKSLNSSNFIFKNREER